MVADKEARALVSSMRVAVDVGGTFTDVFVLDEAVGGVRVAKVPSTPHDPMEGVMAGVAAAGVDLADVDAVLPRHDGRHQRADHAPLPAGGDGHDARASAT